MKKKYSLFGKMRSEEELGDITSALKELSGFLFPEYRISGYDPGISFRSKGAGYAYFQMPLDALISAAQSAKIAIPDCLMEFK